MPKILFGLSLLTLVAQFACSGGSSPTEATATPVRAATPQQAASPEANETPTVPPTEVANPVPIRPAVATPTETATPRVDPTPPAPAADSAKMDRRALVAFYEATGGPNWEYSENWLSAADIGEWQGVTTDADGRVVALHPAGYGLSGELPPELGNLDRLLDLVLKWNQFSGCIPGGGLVGLIPTTLPVEVHFWVTPATLGRWRLLVPWSETLHRRPASKSVPSTLNCSSDSRPCSRACPTIWSRNSLATSASSSRRRF